MHKKPNGYWNFENCKSEALKYSQRSKFEKGCGSAYIIAMRKGWLDSICSHMKSPQRKSGYWTADKCINEAKKYLTAREFEKGSPGAYDASRRHGVYSQCCQHMISPQKEKGYWTKKRCMDEALRFSCRSDFVKGSLAAYSKCHRNGWLEDACGHMGRPKTDANVFYIWKTSHVSKDGAPVYKVGVTSKRLGLSRILHCKNSLASDDARIVFYEEIDDARDLERIAKQAGTVWSGVKGNGYTELRAMVEAELKDLMNICMEAKS